MTSFENPGPSGRSDDPESVARRAGMPGKHPFEEPSHDPSTHEVSGRSDAPKVPVREVRSTGPVPPASKAQKAAMGPDPVRKAAAGPDPKRPGVTRSSIQEPTRAKPESTTYRAAATPQRETRYTGTDRTRTAAAPRRKFNWLLPAALAALAFTFMGLYSSKGDSSDYAQSSMKVDEKLPYPTEIRRTVNEADIDAAEARTAAVKKHEGTVVSESLETDNGYARWDVDILGEDGKVHSVVIDPGNGKILRDTVNTSVNMTDLRNAAASPTSASAVADMVSDSGRTPTQIVYDAGAKEWAATSWRGGNSVQQNYSAATGQMVPVAHEN